MPTDKLVRDAIAHFIESEAPNRRGGRWETIRLRKFDLDKLALRPIAKVTSDDIANWRDRRLKQVPSPSSVARELNLWGALFAMCVERKWLSANPVRGVKRPSEPPARRRGISLDEVSAIVANLNGPSGTQVKAAFHLSLETAMRAGEILGLTWDHVDLANRVVTLPRTKNGDLRQVPLSKAAVDILTERLATVSAEVPVAHDVVKPKCWTITSATLDTLFRRARDKAVADCPSVASVHFHDARSEAITRLSRKLDVLELARVVGHRDLKSLMSYYHASAADLAKKLD